MRILLSMLFIILNTFLFAQTNSQTPVAKDIENIKNFIRDVAVGEMHPDVILSQHVLLSDSLDDGMYDYLEASIAEIQLNLSTKNPAEIQYIPFHQLPRKETRDIDPEGKSTEQMYFLKYRGRQLLAVYIEQDKIASFTLVSKGHKTAHFVTY